MMSYFNGGMGFMWLFALLALVGAALLVILLVRVVGGGLSRGPSASDGMPGDGGTDTSRARQILDERFAKGELTVEDYREHLQALGDKE